MAVLASNAPDTDDGYVGRVVRLDSSGGIVGVTTKPLAGTPNLFTPNGDGTLGGRFRFPTGGPVAFKSATIETTGEEADGVLPVGDGSYYVFSRVGGNLGYVKTATVAGRITGTAFGDTNANGIPDANETRVADRVVYLDANDNGQLDPGERTATTDADGHYAFDALGPGRYVVRRVLPKGAVLTRPTYAITLALGGRAVVRIGTRTA